MRPGLNLEERHAWFHPIQRRLHLPPFEIVLAWMLMLGSVFALYYWNFRSVSNIHAAAVAVNEAGIARWEQVLKRELDQRVWEAAYAALFDPDLIAVIDRGEGLDGLADAFFRRHPVVRQVLALDGEGAFRESNDPAGEATGDLPPEAPFASAVGSALAELGPDEVAAAAFPANDRFYQAVVVRGIESDAGENASNPGHAILVDLDWVERELDLLVDRQQPSRASGRNAVLHANLVRASVASSGGDDVGRNADLLGFVDVAIADEATLGGAALARRSLVLNVISSGLFLTVVIMMGVHITRARKALEMAEKRSAIVGSTSHALRTPLTIMSLYADTLASSRTLNESDREYSEIIARECTRMLHQVEDGLNFARIAAGRQTYNLAPDDLNTLVQTSFASYERYLARSGYTVETCLAEEPLPFLGDAVAISFALDNVIQNAIKYSGNERYIGVATLAEGDEVVVRISDRGVGIPSDEKARIFDEFYRASTSSERRGWGLGLYIVKHVVEGHGGRIHVDSEVGRGTCVRISFPKRASGENDAVGPSRTADATPKATEDALASPGLRFDAGR